MVLLKYSAVPAQAYELLNKFLDSSDLVGFSEPVIDLKMSECKAYVCEMYVFTGMYVVYHAYANLSKTLNPNAKDTILCYHL